MTSVQKVGTTVAHPHSCVPAFYGLAATFLWGSFPLWYVPLAHVPVFELLLHRIVWSSVFIVPLTFWIFSKKEEVLLILRSVRAIVYLVLSSLVLSAWWLSYTYAVVSGHVLDASLGYFISPLLTVGCGLIFFKERATPLTILSITVGLAGVAYYVFVRGDIPLVAAVLALCYTGYTVIRKLNKGVDSQAATMVEVLILTPWCVLAFLFLVATNQVVSYHQTATVDAILFFALGVINVLPMWWYGIAVKEMSLVSVSFMQYIPPSLNFLLGIYVFNEVLDATKLTMFAFIWMGIALYLTQTVLSRKS